MSREVWCIVEHRGGEVDNDSLQLFGAVHRLDGEAVAVVCGDEVAGLAEQISGECDRVISLSSSALASFTPDGYAQAIVPLALERQPSAILTLHSHFLGRDLAPVLASRLGTGLISDCIDVEWRAGFVGKRLVYRRKLIATQRSIVPGIQVATCQRGAFEAPESSGLDAAVEMLSVEIDVDAVRWKVGEFDEAEVVVGDITEADVIVAAGRGVGSKENLDSVQRLAKAIGGTLAASRPLVDHGWLSRGLQVGSSGKTVRPRLYLALGISGAIQHVVGMRDSDVIVAINKDPRAPIFEYADYGIVADLMEIIGPLTDEVEALRG
ncbi:MAG TPA: electron transfer flavoprotein subunit alpha/FixB family protein [Acidobacteriota bacterium]|jgi:electron transfer flavoprotein alpha subunit|nr:electron transfer flavoprotein subunit alpha [Acidobacteriota bacterium]HJO29264.1 electron transfer flavoprotein subunit alpha/FixB family protein [Acidobacteriota bacterium]|tara:strand:- start:371 stop:1339 length:969 start_codon:yes stop_codon:yes gene_type:complete